MSLFKSCILHGTSLWMQEKLIHSEKINRFDEWKAASWVSSSHSCFTEVNIPFNKRKHKAPCRKSWWIFRISNFVILLKGQLKMIIEHLTQQKRETTSSHEHLSHDQRAIWVRHGWVRWHRKVFKRFSTQISPMTPMTLKQDNASFYRENGSCNSHSFKGQFESAMVESDGIAKYSCDCQDKCRQWPRSKTMLKDPKIIIPWKWVSQFPFGWMRSVINGR